MVKFSLILLVTSFFIAHVIPLGEAGGDENKQTVSIASDDAESASTMTFQVTNQFLWDLTNNEIYCPPDDVVKVWIDRLSEMLGVTLYYSRRVIDSIVARANKLRTESRKLKGGRQRKSYFERVWNFQVQSKDVKTIQDLSAENKALKSKVDELHQQVASSSRLLLQAHKGLDQPSKKRKQSASQGEYSARHQRRLKKTRTSDCAASLKWLEQEGVTPLSIVVLNSNGVPETITLRSDHLGEYSDSENMDEQYSDRITMALYIKDRYSISGQAYHEMACIFKQMPRHYKLKQRITELNSMWNIFPTPNGIVGVQQSLKEKLKARVEKLEQDTPDDSPFKTLKKIRIKLSGDSTNIGKRLQVENFTYTLLDEGDSAYSYEGCHPLAMYRAPEKYDYLKAALEDIIKEVTELKTIKTETNEYTIEYYLGGDWKFLALVTGIDSATSKYSCIWCKCPKDQRYDPTTTWSLVDTSQGARTTQENITHASKTTKRFNVSNKPLFENIPLTNVVIDNLHLFLRVSDVLTDLLIVELKRQDAIDKVRTFTSLSMDKYPHLSAYQRLVTSCSISDFQFYVGQTSKQLKCRSLTGPEKLKLFHAINVKELLPGLDDDKVLKIQQLWNRLLQLNRIFSRRASDLSSSDIKNFEDEARSWGQLFISVYHDSHVTPYIHAMINHVSEFMTLHGSILPFTQQSLEKYNDVVTKDYFRSTNHKGESALRQVMEKQNRLEYLRDTGANRPKHHQIKCSNCQTCGHNRLTCPKECSKCGHMPYSSHINDSKKPICDQEN